MQRAFDILFSSLAIIALSPVFIIVIIILKLTGEGEIFFHQERHGISSKKIKLIKFVTMVKNSENIGTGTVTLKNDPRVLPFGNVLRKTKINELPQIFNVLLGNMSLVGPRPHPIALDKKFEKLIENYNDRYNVLPGITGLAQVSGFRGETDSIDKMRNRVLCDIKYGENLNLYLDLKIIMKTFLVIFKGI